MKQLFKRTSVECCYIVRCICYVYVYCIAKKSGSAYARKVILKIKQNTFQV